MFTHVALLCVKMHDRSAEISKYRNTNKSSKIEKYMEVHTGGPLPEDCVQMHVRNTEIPKY